MNPGGDYGKKELSPALRNRFVEIWCPVATTRESFKRIIEHNLNHVRTEADANAVPWADLICDVIECLQDSQRITISTRDLLTWVKFMNRTSDYLTCAQGFYHGAHLVFVDSLGCGTSLRAATLKQEAVDYLLSLLSQRCPGYGGLEFSRSVSFHNEKYGISPFYIDKGPEAKSNLSDYSLSAPGPSENLFRLLRAMQLGKPLLLEGSPGVGKTSLVTSLAQSCGNKIIRINLSEQTDISDLFGADLPVEGGKKVQFAWRDGPFLKALKRGHWIILDEMNLASQSVLEGLNACLDHRGEVFIPELGKKFRVQNSSRLFACQNPLYQGGGRKGLPKSFLNRFTQVYIDKLSPADFLQICTQMFPQLSEDMLHKMIDFTCMVDDLVKAESGSNLWEFNLRDILRWCSLILEHEVTDPGLFVKMLYCSRLRQLELQSKVLKFYQKVFQITEDSSYKYPSSLGQYFHVSMEFVQVGCAVLPKRFYQLPSVNGEVIAPLHCQMATLEVLAYCVKMGWMAIIVGNACTGKSSVVRSLAQLTGCKLLELSVTSVTDTTDLLGGYEQVNWRRHCVNIASRVLDCAVCCLGLASKSADLLEQASVDTLHFLVRELQNDYSPAVCDVGEDKKRLMNQCERLSDITKTIQDLIAGAQLPLRLDLSDAMSNLESLYNRVVNNESSGHFEWVDSVLVEAVKNGHWLLISHANFCNPSVLDRLNALLEPGGVLTLDEKGIIGDHDPVISPHPDFRLFLTMDPSHGEISRALKNRGIEVYTHLEESILNVSKFTDDWKTILSLKTSLDLSCIFEVFRTPMSMGLTPQQLVTLVRCANNLLSTSGASIKTALERAKEMLRVTFDSSAGTDSSAQFIPFSISSSKLSLHPAVYVSKRDFIPLLKIFEIYSMKKSFHHSDFVNSLQTTEYLNSKVFNSALEVFVCSSTSEEKVHRLKMLECVQQIFVNSSFKSIISTWKEVLRDTKLLSSFTTCGGHIFPTCNPLFTFDAGFRFPVTMLPLTAELRLLQTTLKNHLNDRSSHEKSLLCLSQEVYAGLHPGDCLPHSSMMYLHSVVSQIIDFVCQLWLSADTTTTHNQSVQIQQFVDWFAFFISLCVRAHTTFPEFVSGWSLFKINALLPVLPQLESQKGWESIQAHLTNMMPLEDCIKGTKVYDAILRTYHILSDESYVLSKDVQEYDDLILSSSSPREPFLMYPPPVVQYRLSNLLGSKSTHSLICGSQQSMDYGLGTAAALIPLLLALKCILIEKFQGSLSGTFKNKIGQCLQYALQIHPLSLSYLGPLIHFHRCLNSTEIPSIHTGLTQNTLNGFDLANRFSEGVLLERSFLTERCFKLFSSDNDSIHGCFSRTTLHAISLENLNSRREELTTVIQFIWVNEISGSFCAIKNLKTNAKLIKGLFSALVHAIQNTLARFTGNIQIQNISISDKAAVLNLCREASKILSSHVSDENMVIVETCLSETANLVQSLEVALAQAYWSIVPQELDLLTILYYAMVYLGLAYSILLAPAMIDPVALTAAENKCNQTVVESTRILLKCWYEYYRQMVGPEFQASDANATPSYMPRVLNDLCSRLKLISKVEDIHITQRKDIKKYAELYRVTSDVQKSLCAPSHVLSLLDIFKKDSKQANFANVHSWVKAVNGSIQKLAKDFADLPDVVSPFSMALTMMIQGIGSLSMVKKYCEEEPLKSELVFIRALLQYPLNSMFKSQAHWLESLVSFVIQDGMLYTEDFIQQRLLEVALLACKDHLSLSNRRHKQLKHVVLKLVKLMCTKWKQAQETAQTEAIEAESLYRWRAKEHDIAQLDDDGIDELQQKLFPSLNSMFSDKEHIDVDAAERNSISDKRVSNIDTNNLITSLHMLWFNKQPLAKQECRTFVPEVELYELFGLCHSKLQYIPGFTSDFYLHGAHVRMCREIQKSLAQHEANGYNVYKQGSIMEAERLLPIVKKILTRVTEFLQEWPEHPILNEISRVCHRVLSISVHEPLMKFLSGSECVLNKIQEWESYSSSQVSFKVELSDLMQLILDWRRLEMNFYETMLEWCGNEMKAGVSLWWFHLYGLCSETSDKVSDFLLAIQSFMETSPLGEFSSRLQLIDTFQAHVLTEGRKDLADVLGNVKGYYSQFVSNVKASLEQLTAVIVKNFKDQLSVMRWSDGSYWSLKSSVHSSHKRLCSLFKKYKDILCEPVLPVLTDASINGHLDNSGQEQPLMAVVAATLQSLTLSVLDFNCYDDLVLFEDGQLVVNTHDTLRKMSEVLNSFFDNTDCARYIEGLNEFAGNIAASVIELSSNSFLDNLEEDKIESSIKSRQSLKRKMLSDLFKELVNLGFSFKKGLDFCSSCSIKDILQTPLEDLHPQMSSVDALWSKMHYYYHRSIAKLMAVQSAFVNPSKELTLHQTSRCKGFAYSLLQASLIQRHTLMMGLRNYKELTYAVDAVTSSCTGRTCILTSEFSKWMKCLCDMLEQCLHVIQSVHYLLGTVPAELDLSLSLLPPESLKVHTSERIDEFTVLKDCENELRLVYNNAIQLESCWFSSQQFFVSKQDLEFLRKGYSSVQNFCTQLSSCQTYLQAERSSIFSFLEIYCKQLFEKCDQFDTWLSSTTSEENLRMDARLTLPLVKLILLAFQKVSLLSSKQERKKMFSSESIVEPSSWKSLLENSTAAIKAMNIEQITTEINKFLLICSSNNVTIAVNQMRILLKILTFYQHLCCACFTQSMMVQTALCKLSSILYSVFATLVSKGFCVPSKDVCDGSSSVTDYVGIEAGGFSEGKGDKNVSSEAEPENMEPGKNSERDEYDNQKANEDDDAISVTEDIDNNPANVEHGSNSEDSENQENDEEELDNKMEDFKPEDNPENLDKEMWAPDTDKNEQNIPESNLEGGADINDDTDIVAKDETLQESAELNEASAKEPTEESVEPVNFMDFEQPEDTMEPDNEECELTEIVESGFSDNESSETEMEHEEIKLDEDMPKKDSATMESSEMGYSTTEPVLDSTVQSFSGLDSENTGPPADLTSSQSGDSNAKNSAKVSDSSQKKLCSRHKRISENETRVRDDDMENCAKRARLEEQDSTVDVPDHEDNSLYRHISVAEVTNAESVVWDGSTKQGRRSSFTEQEEVSIVEEFSPIVEKGEKRDTGGKMGNDAILVDPEKIIENHNEGFKPSIPLNSTSNNNFFSRPEWNHKNKVSILREEMLLNVEFLQQDESAILSDAMFLWRQYTDLTQGLAQALYEELCLILTPTAGSQLRGDYRSGKRLNMRRVIPFIASNYQNDRIWLRRTKLVDRRYQVIVAVDDSSSMQDNNCRQMAYESLAVLTSAISRLTNGQVGVCRFGENSELLHPLDQPFTDDGGGHLLQHLTFTQNATSYKMLLQTVRSVFLNSSPQASSSTMFGRLLIILSDGRGVFSDGGVVVEKGIQKLTEVGIFTVLIILDTLKKDSITDVKVPIFSPEKGPVISPYLEVLPFPFYVIIRDLHKMPVILGEALRQWFELLAN